MKLPLDIIIIIVHGLINTSHAVPDAPGVEEIIPHYSNDSQSLIKLTLNINQTVSFILANLFSTCGNQLHACIMYNACSYLYSMNPYTYSKCIGVYKRFLSVFTIYRESLHTRFLLTVRIVVYTCDHSLFYL